MLRPIALCCLNHSKLQSEPVLRCPMLQVLWWFLCCVADGSFLTVYSIYSIVRALCLLFLYIFTSTYLPLVFLFVTAALRVLMLWCGLCSTLESLVLGKGLLKSLFHPQPDSLNSLLIKIEARLAFLDNELQKKLDLLYFTYRNGTQDIKAQQLLCEEGFSESATRLFSSLSDLLVSIDVSAIHVLLDCPGLFAFYVSLLWACYQVLHLPYNLLQWTFRRWVMPLLTRTTALCACHLFLGMPVDYYVEFVIRLTNEGMLNCVGMLLTMVVTFGVASAMVYAYFNFKIRMDPDLGPMPPKGSDEDLFVVFLASAFSFFLTPLWLFVPACYVISVIVAVTLLLILALFSFGKRWKEWG